MQATYETDLIYRAQTADGDYQFGRNRQGFLSGQAAMRQVLQTRLRESQNEWWEGDPGALPWATDILGLPCTEENLQRVDLMIADRILDTVGVVGIAEQTSGYSNRQYACDCVVNTVYGEVKVTTSEQ